MSHSTHVGFSCPLSSSLVTIVLSFSREPLPPHLHIAAPPLLVIAVGVGQNEHPVPDMRGTNVGSRYAMPFCIIPDRGQVSENSAHPPNKQRCHVLQHHDSGPELLNHANGFKEQPGSFAVKSCPESGVGNILARKPAADNVDGLQVVFPAFPNVSFPVDAGPVFCQDSVCIIINLHLPFACHASAFKTKVKAADASEE
jgi:hypothetical protein